MYNYYGLLDGSNGLGWVTENCQSQPHSSFCSLSHTPESFISANLKNLNVTLSPLNINQGIYFLYSRFSYSYILIFQET